MATREYAFINGPETSTLPSVTDPSADSDDITKVYADKTYTRGVADLTALKAIDASHRSDLCSVYVRSLDAYFQFVSASSSTANDISIVQPSAGSGRWFRVKDADRDSWYDSVAAVSDVKAVDATERQDRQIIFVKALGKIFYFDSSSSATGDDTTVIQPTSGSGRWLQVAPGTAANEFQAVVANPAITGFSTHTTIASAIAAVSAGANILITAGTYSENVSVDKQLNIRGIGKATIISGNLTFTSASDYSHVYNLKFTGVLTFNSGSVGNVVDQVWVPSAWSATASNFVDSNTTAFNNFFQAMEE